jgi:hypothetical protein
MGVATSTAILGAAAIGAVGAGMQADAAKDAAAMQVAGGDRALSNNCEPMSMGREDQAPYRENRVHGSSRHHQADAAIYQSVW